MAEDMANKTQEPGDTQVMEMVKGGDSNAFRFIVERYQNYVFNIIYRYVGDSFLAEDLAQDVFHKVFMAKDSYESKAKFSTWLFRITANVCLNHLRDEQKRKHRTMMAPGGLSTKLYFDPADTLSNSPTVLVRKEELEEKVRLALQDLPENQRLALILFRYEDHGYQEIADIMGLSVPALKSLMHRAREALAEKLEKYESEE